MKQKKPQVDSALRRRLLKEYDFGADPAALLLLDELCGAVAQLRAVQATLLADGAVTTGAKGQRIAHPLLAEQDRLRRTVLAYTRALRISLPE